MLAFGGSLAQSFAHVGSQGIGEILAEGAQHLGEQLPLRGGVVDVLCDGHEGHAMLGQDGQRFQGDSQVS
ncbi:MAG: hypothetical protein DRI40_04285 [Chloroflexi bacterium]|nr:MAG: hypothetical protein DRI40_04285 [Chloroflexota bacterium]